ncbi:MAG: ribonuclease III [Capsulimonadales bacterium]|nr:ribonuclease III [Capsulimonadales bacterium]
MTRNADEPASVAPESLASFAEKWGFSGSSERLKQALTHTSAATNVAESNERLEFLGDALLSSWVARYLFAALPPETREDTLSRARVRIVRKETLAAAGRALRLSDWLDVGRGERKENRQERDSLIADAFEAVVAALFLDAGEEAMNRFLRVTLAEPLREVIEFPPEDDPKTRLQIRLQADGRGLPLYETIEEKRDREHHHFTVAVRTADGTILGTGSGSSKRAAQRMAALHALERTEPAPTDPTDPPTSPSDGRGTMPDC